MLTFFAEHSDEIVGLALFFAFALPLFTLGIHTFCAGILESRLAASHSKRAMKEARRDYVHTRHFSGLLLDWQRTLAGENDASAQKICTLNAVILGLFPFGEALCIAGYWLPVCAGLGAVLSIIYLVLLLVLWAADSRVRKRVPEKKSPYEKNVPMAHLLSQGYALLALGFLYARLALPAGILLTVNAVHLLILRRRKSDLYYCTVQCIQHRATTPHHHSEQFRKFALREGRNFAIFELAVGVPCIVCSIVAFILEHI